MKTTRVPVKNMTFYSPSHRRRFLDNQQNLINLVPEKLASWQQFALTTGLTLVAAGAIWLMLVLWLS